MAAAQAPAHNAHLAGMTAHNHAVPLRCHLMDTWCAKLAVAPGEAGPKASHPLRHTKSVPRIQVKFGPPQTGGTYE